MMAQFWKRVPWGNGAFKRARRNPNAKAAWKPKMHVVMGLLSTGAAIANVRPIGLAENILMVTASAFAMT